MTYENIERCETCGECVDETEIRYDADENRTWCTSPNCGE